MSDRPGSPVRDVAAAGRGALLGTLLGDAIGAPFEGLAAGDGEARLEHARAQPVLPFTDDTQLALALTEHLLDVPEVEPDGLRAAFATAYDPRRGYGAGMRLTVAAWRQGMPTDAAARVAFDDGSFGNGAAMRVAPVGVRWAHEPERVVEVGARSARVTHVHPIGVDGAVVQARAVAHAVVHGGFDADALGRLRDVATTPEFGDALADAERLAAREGVAPAAAADVLGAGVAAHRSVPLALWVAATTGDVGAALLAVLAAGGDTDTIGAMAVAVLGAAHRGVPPALLANVERGPGGVDEIVEAADALTDALAATTDGDPAVGWPREAPD